MREILFKAKRKDNGEWVEWYLFDNGITEQKRYFVGGLVIEPYTGTACDEWDITGIDFYEIDPDTLCQYTGLTDKNGKKIWENDICEMVYDGAMHVYVVVWDREELDFKGTNGKENYGENFEYLGCCEELVAIGNIFDNADLLEVE